MRRQNTRTISLIVCTVAYLLVGAAIFDKCESQHEEKQKNALLIFENMLKQKYNITEEDFRIITTVVIKSVPHKAGIQWKFSGAFYFATTVLTTIGYGHSTPATFWGKTFCMCYALAGIPLGLVMFQSIGERLNNFVLKGLIACKKCFKCKTKEVTETNLILFVSVLSTLVMTSGAAAFSHFEKWEYFDAFYYCFITLTTIGFGDYVALQKDGALQAQVEYVLFSLAFILFGLSVVSAAINLLVLRFLTLNTVDERRDEAEAATAAQYSVRLEGDVITANGSIIGIPDSDDDDYDDITPDGGGSSGGVGPGKNAPSGSNRRGSTVVRRRTNAQNNGNANRSIAQNARGRSVSTSGTGARPNVHNSRDDNISVCSCTCYGNSSTRYWNASTTRAYIDPADPTAGFSNVDFGRKRSSLRNNNNHNNNNLILNNNSNDRHESGNGSRTIRYYYGDDTLLGMDIRSVDDYADMKRNKRNKTGTGKQRVSSGLFSRRRSSSNHGGPSFFSRLTGKKSPRIVNEEYCFNSNSETAIQFEPDNGEVYDQFQGRPGTDISRTTIFTTTNRKSKKVKLKSKPIVSGLIGRSHANKDEAAGVVGVRGCGNGNNDDDDDVDDEIGVGLRSDFRMSDLSSKQSEQNRSSSALLPRMTPSPWTLPEEEVPVASGTSGSSYFCSSNRTYLEVGEVTTSFLDGSKHEPQQHHQKQTYLQHQQSAHYSAGQLTCDIPGPSSSGSTAMMLPYESYGPFPVADDHEHDHNPTSASDRRLIVQSNNDHSDDELFDRRPALPTQSCQASSNRTSF